MSRAVVIALACLVSLGASGAPRRRRKPPPPPVEETRPAEQAGDAEPKPAAPKPAEPKPPPAKAAALDLLDVPDFGCRRLRKPVLTEGPIQLGFWDADVATARRACPRTEATFGLRGGATVDLPGFYGLLGASALAGGSYAVRRDLEVFATAELVRYQFGINATLYGQSVALGSLTAGATWVALEQGAFVIGATTRLLLPTSFASPNTRPIGLELGVPLSVRPLTELELHLFAGADASVGLGVGPAVPLFGVTLAAGLELAPVSWLGLVFDANVHLLRHATLDYFAPAFAVRVAPWRGLSVEASVSAQLGGRRALVTEPDLRLDAAAALSLAWRL